MPKIGIGIGTETRTETETGINSFFSTIKNENNTTTTANTITIVKDKEGERRPWANNIGYVDEYIKWYSEEYGSKHPTDCKGEVRANMLRKS